MLTRKRITTLFLAGLFPDSSSGVKACNCIGLKCTDYSCVKFWEMMLEHPAKIKKAICLLQTAEETYQ